MTTHPSTSVAPITKHTAAVLKTFPIEQGRNGDLVWEESRLDFLGAETNQHHMILLTSRHEN